jgi:transcriptional regulator with XRE-family HTH domain
MEIGQRLSRARTGAQLTQKQVAETLHVTRSTISNWENSRSYPDIASLVQLTTLYQMSLDQLIKEDDGIMADMQKKEQQRRDGLLVYWAVTAISVLIAVIIYASLFGVAGFAMSKWVRVFLFVVFTLNIGVSHGVRLLRRLRSHD